MANWRSIFSFIAWAALLLLTIDKPAMKYTGTVSRRRCL